MADKHTQRASKPKDTKSLTPYKALWGVDVFVDNRIGSGTLLPHPKRSSTLRCNATTLRRLKLAIDMLPNKEDAGLYLRKYYEFQVAHNPRHLIGLATV